MAMGMLSMSDVGLSDSPDQWRADVQRARKGDSNSFAKLVRSVQRQVYGTCLRLLRREAEAAEVAQESFLRAYQNLERYDETRPFDLWVMAIARNLCLDVLRRRKFVQTDEIDDNTKAIASTEASLEEAAIASQERRSLEDAMNSLPEDDREILGLYYVQKRTTKESAVLINVAPGTVMARLFRAREKLRQKMLPAAAAQASACEGARRESPMRNNP
jgi:RNA polymerase sigma-70 factor, ECF subfamily